MVLIAMTLVVCASVVLLRQEIRGRWWALELRRSDSLEQRANYVAAIAGLGAAGSWGISALLADNEASVRASGVRTLAQIPGDWSSMRLRELLIDRDSAIQLSAAAALVRRGDAAALPTLKWIFITGSDEQAEGVCDALGRANSIDATLLLGELTFEPASALRRAALAETLGSVGQPDCVPPLLRLLADDRPTGATFQEQRVAELVATMQADGTSAMPQAALSQPGSRRTVAERAAVALRKITGLDPPFASTASAAERAAAERIWADWHAARTSGP